MGFDPRRWRPSSGSRPLTTNAEALLAENEALRREVRALRLQLEAFLQGESAGSRSWAPSGGSPESETAADAGGVWSSSARSRASRPSWSSAEPPRQRVTVGSTHGISPELVERWSRSLARHPRWTELRIGPPAGLRGLEQDLRRHWWNPGLSLEQELDRRSPGLGGELNEALRGPHSRGRWAVRVAFALYGPRAPEWLSEEPLRVVEELLQRVQQLQQRQGSGSRRSGTRTANHSGSAAGPHAGGSHASDRHASDSRAAGTGATGRGTSGSSGGPESRRGANGGTAGGTAGGGTGDATRGGERGRRHAGPGRQAGAEWGGARDRGAQSHADARQGSGQSDRRTSRRAASPDPRSQALALLGLEPGASPAAIKRAYRRLAKAHHPDLGGDAEAFRRLDDAYRSLL
jgi:hypothetical protein